jgi:hypothetical protein
LPQGSNLEIGDLQDDRVSPADWAEQEASARTARVTGSFLGPVLEAIENRRCENHGLDAVTVLLFTDGELLDFAPVAVPASMRIVGLAPAIDPGKLRHWGRVLPGTPLYTLADSALDDALRVDSYPFHGACQLAWQIEGRPINVHCLDPAQGTTKTPESSAITWNMLDGPAYLVFVMSSQEFSRVRLTCTSLRKRGLVVPLPNAGPPLSLAPAWLSAIEAAIIGQVSDQTEVVFDMTAGCEGFDRVWEALRIAGGLAAQRAEWVDSEGRLVVFTDLIFESRLFVGQARPKWDALLCLFRGDPQAPPDKDSRIVVLALQRTRHPALRWRPDTPLPFGVPLRSIEIEYDRGDDSWKIRYGENKPTDLQIGGSEDLGQRKEPLRLLGAGWNALFSGDLRSRQTTLR